MHQSLASAPSITEVQSSCQVSPWTTDVHLYIADMLSRAYLQADHSQRESIPEYQIFQLSQEQLLFQEIADINQLDYMCLSEGTHQQIKQCTIADATLQSLMNMIMTGWPLTKEEVPVCIREYWN